MHEFKLARQISEQIRFKGIPEFASIQLLNSANLSSEELEKHLKNFLKCKVEVLESESAEKCKCGYYGMPKIADSFLVCPECSATLREMNFSDFAIKEVKYRS